MKTRFQSLGPAELLNGIRHARGEEKRILTDLLHYLLEIDRRKLHLEWGFTSLFTFLTEELGYEKASAYRRLEAMRALKAVPELEEKIKTGALTLTTITQVQQVIRHEPQPVTQQERRNLFALVEHKSKTEAERILFQARPQAMAAIQQKQDSRERPIADNRTELRLILTPEQFAKWEKLKDLRAHANFDRSNETLLDYLLDLGLHKLDPEQKKSKEPAPRQPQELPMSSAAEPQTAQPPARQPIPTWMRVQVFKRDRGRCNYVSPTTRRACGSTHGLQLDHITPVFRGGTNTPENLRLLCGAHNRARRYDEALK